MSFVKFPGHTGPEIADFDPNCAFSDCNSILNSQMAMNWCTQLQVALKGRPFVFQGHPSSFKIARDKTLSILNRIGLFRTVISGWIDQWLWSNTEISKWHRRGGTPQYIKNNILKYSSYWLSSAWHYTISEWSTIILPTKVRLILETWRYFGNRTHRTLDSINNAINNPSVWKLVDLKVVFYVYCMYDSRAVEGKLTPGMINHVYYAINGVGRADG